MKIVSKKRFLSLLVLTGALIFNTIGISAAEVREIPAGDDPQIKTLAIGFSGSCVLKVTVDPPDINGNSTYNFNPMFEAPKPFQYEVGTEVKITNITPVIRCGTDFHCLQDNEDTLSLVMDSDKSVTFNYHDVHKGDINADGSVNSIDFANFRKVLLGTNTQKFFPMLLDLDKDGEVTSIDFALLRQQLLGLNKM
ncbi:dockerin type I repeat-containing protein [Acetivibrio cellulolyticus]|uniref:dockerin type I repeat-containing protein n=1 Tax=Acetivibrio cellulolyticus TaxID=35830 RepID=UPI0001E2C2B5|nr:dockerin type I repeat-containing protein [Acetivibrio cellulolyticus]